MENKGEDEIRKKWQQEAKDEAKRDEEAAQRPKKRPRAIGYHNDADDVMNDLKLEALLGGTADRSRSATKTRGVTKTRRAGGSHAKSRPTELTEEEEDVVELD